MVLPSQCPSPSVPDVLLRGVSVMSGVSGVSSFGPQVKRVERDTVREMSVVEQVKSVYKYSLDPPRV